MHYQLRIKKKNKMKKLLFLIRVIVLLQIATCILPTISYSQLIAGGDGYTLVVCNDHTVSGWGANYFGQLGNGTNTDSNTPVYVSGLTSVIAVSASGVGLIDEKVHSLALKEDGTVWAWGINCHGQFGNGTYNDSNIPVQVIGLTGIIAIDCGFYSEYSIALKNDGTVWAWGLNSEGMLGNGTYTDNNIPVQVSGLTEL
jgi:alpha-tubulin suppressor-like RCC1 family protein